MISWNFRQVIKQIKHMNMRDLFRSDLLMTDNIPFNFGKCCFIHILYFYQSLVSLQVNNSLTRHQEGCIKTKRSCGKFVLTRTQWLCMKEVHTMLISRGYNIRSALENENQQWYHVGKRQKKKMAPLTYIYHLIQCHLSYDTKAAIDNKKKCWAHLSKLT